MGNCEGSTAHLLSILEGVCIPVANIISISRVFVQHAIFPSLTGTAPVIQRSRNQNRDDERQQQADTGKKHYPKQPKPAGSDFYVALTADLPRFSANLCHCGSNLPPWRCGHNHDANATPQKVDTQQQPFDRHVREPHAALDCGHKERGHVFQLLQEGVHIRWESVGWISNAYMNAERRSQSHFPHRDPGLPPSRVCKLTPRSREGNRERIWQPRPSSSKWLMLYLHSNSRIECTSCRINF